MIKVDNLVKKYGDHVAVDHLSFEVKPGQIYGFLGPNGAGKSTTMNIMTGYLAATEGTVTINGYDILTQPKEAKKCIGYLPEIPPLYMDMKVDEYLSFVAQLKEVDRSIVKEQLAEIKELVKIQDVSGKLIKHLSKGYKQRVGLAQALIGYPQVIILDEPTVGLDPLQIIEIRDLIKRLGDKHTVILSSHILSEVSAVCDQIMIIAHGKLVACDTPEVLANNMNVKNELQITVMGDETSIKEVLDQLPIISSYSVLPAEQSGNYILHVASDDMETLQKEIAMKLALSGIAVLSMEINKSSLEDIFLTLTTNEQEDEIDEGNL